MASRRKLQKSQWLGAALGAGASAGLTAAGLGGLSKYGGMLGNFAGDYIKTVTGFGAYNVSQNVLYEGAQAPYVRNYDGTNGTVICHREFIQDIITSDTASTFKLQSFPINPGLSETFEFLAQIASNYEEYSIEGMLFMFRSMSADALNSTNTALGTVIMATDYNTAAQPFQSKAGMEASQYSMSGRPSESMIHPIECDPSKTPLTLMYTRSGSIPFGTDRRFYDLGDFYIATTGFQGTSVNIGELWVSYQVALLKPRLYVSLGYFIDYYSRSSTGIFGSTSILGTDGVLNSKTNMSILFVDGSLYTDIIFPTYPQPTTFFVNLLWNFSAGVATPDRTFTTLNCTDATNTYCSLPFLGAPNGGVGTQRFEAQGFFACPGGESPSSARITLSAYNAPTSTLVVIIQVPN